MPFDTMNMMNQSTNTKKSNFTRCSMKGKKFKKQSKKASNFNYLNIYVTGLPAYTIKDEFRSYLEKFGDIKNVKIPYRKSKGVKECKGHAKVEVANKRSYNQLLNLKNVKFMGEHSLKFEPFLNGEVLVGKMLEIESRQVSIYGFEGPTKEEIKNSFIKFGEIENVNWDKRPSDILFFGSIIFTNQESAQTCLQTGECRINKTSVIKVRPYISQFAEKAKKIHVKKRNQPKKQHQDDSIFLDKLRKQSSIASPSTKEGTPQTSTNNSSQDSSSENLSVASVDRNTPANVNTRGQKFSSLGSMNFSDGEDKTSNSPADHSQVKTKACKKNKSKTKPRRKRKLRHPINFNQNSLSDEKASS